MPTGKDRCHAEKSALLLLEDLPLDFLPKTGISLWIPLVHDGVRMDSFASYLASIG
jgi:hypothetical protein